MGGRPPYYFWSTYGKPTDGSGGTGPIKDKADDEDYCDTRYSLIEFDKSDLDSVCSDAGLDEPYRNAKWSQPNDPKQYYRMVGKKRLELGCELGQIEDANGNCVPVDPPAPPGWPCGQGEVVYDDKCYPLTANDRCDPKNEVSIGGKCYPIDQQPPAWPAWDCDADEVYVEEIGNCVVPEPAQKTPPPPPPCWSAEALNNCPVGGALRFVAPKYAMVGVPVTMYAYASWRPDANAPSQPTNGTAVIRVDGEDYSGVEFVDGIAEWRFIPETEGMKEFTASGVLFSGLSGANAYIDTVPARTYVLEYDPAAYAKALKNKAVEVGDTYVITDPNQARSYAEGRYEWSVSSKSEDVCAVYETKKGAVKAKFNGEGKCTVIWLDKESEESGKYTFIAKK